jgi:predicted PurR-regulated permease PerM
MPAAMRTETGTWFARGVGLTVGVALVVLAAFVVARATDVVVLVFLAILLGSALEPVVGSIRARIGIGRGLGILIVFATFLIAVVLIGLLIVPAAAVQLGAAIARLPTFLEGVRAWSAQIRPAYLGDGVAALVTAAEAPLKPGAPPDPTAVVEASVGALSGLAALVTLLVLVFFWLTERSRLQWYALSFVPLERRAGVRHAWNEVEARLGLWARGQLILMVAIGVATGIAYTLIGLPAALLLALIAAVAEVVPIAGPAIGAVPALLVATTVSPGTALITLAVYVALQFIEGNVLVPIVMRGTVGLSPFIVLVSLLVGWTAGGPLAAIVAVPLVAGVEVVLERLQDRETPVAIDASAERDAEASERDQLEGAPDAPGTAKARDRSSRSGPRGTGPSRRGRSSPRSQRSASS